MIQLVTFHCLSTLLTVLPFLRKYTTFVFFQNFKAHVSDLRICFIVSAVGTMYHILEESSCEYSFFDIFCPFHFAGSRHLTYDTVRYIRCVNVFALYVSVHINQSMIVNKKDEPAEKLPAPFSLWAASSCFT